MQRNYAVIALAASLMLALTTSVAQSPQSTEKQATGQQQPAENAPPQGTIVSRAAVERARAPEPPADPTIAAALKQVSAQQIRQTIEKLVSFGNRNTVGGNDKELAATGKGVIAAREWIRSEFERYSAACGGCLEVKLDTFTTPPSQRIKQPTELINVYAVMRGADPQNAGRIYLVTGHYDSFTTREMFDDKIDAPGANDDGSGTAVSLECARVLSRHKFPATIVFLTVAGEEQGLLGSKHFAQLAKSENWNLGAALNNDIVGGNTTPGDTLQNKNIVRVFSEGIPYTATEQELRTIRGAGYESDSASRELARYIREVGRTYRANMNSGAFGAMVEMRPDRFGRGGDHTSFNQEGFTAVRFTEYREDFNHQHQVVRVENGIQYGDLPQFVDFNYVANVARLNAATLTSLASAPAPPTNVRFATRPDNNSTIAWEAPPGDSKEAASYEVVWRLTSSPDWEHAVDVGNPTSATLPDSKDNVIFAVRTA